MTFNEYQELAARTIASQFRDDQERHSLYGLIAEVGELNSLYQKMYQGHWFDSEHAKKEVGDILWMIAEYCTSQYWELDEIAEMNIEKLRQRYPDGFDAERSLHRKAGDI